MNPHIPKIEQDDTKFTHDCFLFYKTVHQDPEKIQQLEQKTSQAINNICEKVKTLDLTKPIQEQKPEDQFSILKGVLFSYLRSEGHQAQLCEGQGSEEDLISFYQSLSFLTGQINNSQYYELSIPDTDEASYKNIISDYSNLKQFTQNFITAASKARQVPEKSIHILNLKKGSIKIHYIIKETVNTCIEQIKTVFSETFKNISLALKSLLSNSIIKDSYFDSKFDYYWDESHQRIRSYRGSLPELDKELQPKRYFFPINYFGFGINVEKIMVNNNTDWLKKGPKAWIVLYHGTSLQGYQGIAETFIQPGTKNHYGNKNFKSGLLAKLQKQERELILIYQTQLLQKSIRQLSEIQQSNTVNQLSFVGKSIIQFFNAEQIQNMQRVLKRKNIFIQLKLSMQKITQNPTEFY
ncbi:hypothetical protein ABPG72_021837 [Tetrahymena utriculariae]